MANMGTHNGVRQDVEAVTQEIRRLAEELDQRVNDHSPIERMKELLKDIENKEVE